MTANRRGFTTLEVVAAIGIMAAAVALGAQVAHMAALQRRGSLQHSIAVQEAANVMERLSLVRWHDLTPEKIAKVELSKEAAAQLSDGAILATLQRSGQESLEVKRVSVTVTWGAEERQRNVTLSRWRTRSEEQP